MSVIRGHPERLEGYSTDALAAFGDVDATVGSYSSACATFAAAPNDLHTVIPDRSAMVGAALDSLRALDREPAAFAFALRQLDHFEPDTPRDRTWKQTADEDMFLALVQARLEDPNRTPEEVRRRALDIRYGSGADIGRELNDLVTRLHLSDDDVDQLRSALSLVVQQQANAYPPEPGVNWALARNILSVDGPDSLRDLTVDPAEMDRIAEALRARGEDQAFLHDLFAQMSPATATRVPDLFAAVTWHELSTKAQDGPTLDLPFDPRSWAAAYSDALGAASRTGAVDSSFWDGFFDQDNWMHTEHHSWPWHDKQVLSDTFPVLFISGTFSADVARRIGTLGLLVADHKLDVDKVGHPVGSVFFDGFDELDTHWEDRFGLMLDAAARTPAAAAELVASTDRDLGLGSLHLDRTPVEVLTDLDYDHMDKGLVSAYYGRTIRAATIGAEDAADVNGDGQLTGQEPDLVLSAWRATINVFGAVAANHDNGDAYDHALSDVFAELALRDEDHMLVNGHRSDGEASTTTLLGGRPDSLLPRAGEVGIEFDSATLAKYFATVMRDRDTRISILAQSEAVQRAVLADTFANHPGDLDAVANNLGRLRGALAAGAYEANGRSANETAADMEARDKLLERGFGLAEFGIGLLPGGSLVTKTVKYTADVASAAHLTDDALDWAKSDPDGVRQRAEAENLESLRNQAGQNRDVLVDGAYLALRHELATSPNHLSPQARRLQAQLPHGLDPATTTLEDFHRDPLYEHVAEQMIASPDALADSFQGMEIAFLDAGSSAFTTVHK